MKHFILMTIITLFIGCGSSPSSKVSDTPYVPEKQQTPNSAEDIFTIGDDQNVLEGSSVKISASILDNSKAFTKFTWTENGKIVSTSEEFTADNLSAGEHHISLEVVDQDGKIYEDTVVVIIKKELTTNKPPVAKSLNFVLKEDEQFLGSLGGSDEDGDELSYLFVSFPQHGRLSGSAANLRYTPDSNYNGVDSFVYKTNDGEIDSQYATVSIEIESVNDAPIVTAQTIRLSEDSSKNITLSGSDVDKDALTFTYTYPSHGTFDGTTYTPEENYFGSDSFTFTANDREENSLPAIVSIIIAPVNDAPAFTSSATLTINEDEAYSYNITTNDIENDMVSLSLTTAPAWLTLSGNTLSGIPQNGDVGSHPIKITASDSRKEVTQTFNITVSNVNDVPIGVDDIVTTQEDTPILIDVLANDTDDDDDILSIATISQPSHGTVEIVGTEVRYTPELNYHGTDSFTYQPKDVAVSGASTIVSITVDSVDDKAIFTSIPVTQAVEAKEYNYAIVASDADNNITLSMGANTPAWLTLNNNILSGMAPSGQADAVYAIQVIANSIDQNFTITIKDVNFAPEFTNTAIIIDTYEDNNSISGTFTATDSDVDDYYFTTESNLTGLRLNLDGTFDLNLSSEFYQALQVDENISETVLIKVIDEAGASDEQNLTIMIAGINDIPIAVNDTNTTNEDSNITFNILANDTDVDNGAILILVDVNFTEGNATFTADGNLTFSPIGDFDYLVQDEEHNVTLTYLMRDEHHATSEANITITIFGIDDVVIIEPITVEDSNLSDTNGTIAGTITANDADADVIFTDANTTNGFDINSTTGVYTFTPPAGAYDYLAVGESTILTIPIMIGNVAQDINITIIGKNDAPTITSISQRYVSEDDSPINDTIIVTDPDIGDTLTFEAPFVSDFFLNSDGTYSFNPMNYQNLTIGEEEKLTIPITVSDGTLSDTKNLTITITGANDAPIASAGNDINVSEHTMVDFNASGSSDAEDETLTYAWKEGTTLLSSAETFNKSDFSGGEHTITLTVTDSDGLSNTDTLTVIVTEMFTQHIVLENMGTPEGTYLADVDRDGFIDILTAGYGTGDNGWLHNEGNRSFSSTLNTIDNSNNPESIFSIDLNRDGEMDIISGKDKNRWTWYENDGEQNFTEYTINTSAKTNYIVVTDFDKDGDIDIYYGGWNGSIAWSENDGEQNFTDHQISTSLGTVATVQAVDMDNDGDLDFVAALLSNGEIAWYENQDDNLNFDERVLATGATNIFSVSIADIDQDGYQDIIAGPDNNGTVHWFLNNKTDTDENKTFTHMTNNDTEWSSLASKFGSTVTGDLDNDGDIDVLYTSYDKGELGWFENDGTGSFSGKHVIQIVTGMQPLDPYLADLDNDGDLDFALALVGTKQYAWYENNLRSGDEVQELPKTGQQSLYANFDDGDYKKGLDNNYSKNSMTNIVKDSATSLMWQDDTDAADKTMTWADAMTYCESSILGGFQDWRLPEIQTLYHLAKKDTIPTLDSSHFENVAAAKYWSSDFNPDLSYATFVDFSNATDDAVYTKEVTIFITIPAPEEHVRCVRGNREKFNFSRDDTNDIVIDNTHKLIWNDGIEANTTTKTWQEAIYYCDSELGTQGEWRLPNVHELYSIVDSAKSDSAFESSFIYTSSERFWSSTTDNQSDSAVEKRYGIQYDYGHDFSETSSSKLYNVRCVKDF